METNTIIRDTVSGSRGYGWCYCNVIEMHGIILLTRLNNRRCAAVEVAADVGRFWSPWLYHGMSHPPSSYGVDVLFLVLHFGADRCTGPRREGHMKRPSSVRWCPIFLVLKLKGSGKGGVCVWCTPFVCRWQNFVRDCS